jgi:uncharacterized protein YoaH (UPF0181 family)
MERSMLDTEDPNNLTPEQIQQLMDAGVSQDKIAQLMKSAEGGDKTFDEAFTGKNLKGREAGGGFVANNPLEFLAQGLRGYKEKKAAEADRGQADTLRQGVADARKLYMNTGVLGRNADPNMDAMGMDAQMRPDTTIGGHNVQDMGAPDMSGLGSGDGMQQIADSLRTRIARKQDAAAPGKKDAEPDAMDPNEFLEGDETGLEGDPVNGAPYAPSQDLFRKRRRGGF